ncbi:MAG: chorismate-binding protein, partial [bacterium]
MPLLELPYASAPELIAERLPSGLAPLLLHAAPDAGGLRSYLGVGPLATLEWWSPARWETFGWEPSDPQLSSHPLRMLEEFATTTAQSYRFLEERVNRFPFPTPFLSGLLGFLSFELGEYILPKLDRRAPPQTVPLLGFWRYALLYVVHHRRRRAFAWWPSCGTSKQKKLREKALEELRKILRERGARPDSMLRCDASKECLRGALKSGEATSSLPFAAYSRAFEQGQELIRAGDIYQFNLTHQISLRFGGNPWSAFHRLMQTTPATRAAAIVRPDYAILSASPERLVERRGRAVCTSPIKGTRLRTGVASADRYARTELRRCAKDLAEHVMIVDLERNDLGRVCEYGSICAKPMFSIQTLPSLYHLVSTVRGRL